MSYRPRKEDDAESDGMSVVMECRFCGQPSTRGELSQHGARCAPCYQRWCSDAQAHEQLDATGSPAEQLVQRLSTFEQRTGRRLTDGQRFVLAACERKLGMQETHSSG